MTDESAIRQLQRTWFRAPMDGDITTLSDLMTDDLVFLTTGRPPDGRQAFLESFKTMNEQVVMSCDGEYEEIIVTDDFAYVCATTSVSASSTLP